MEINLNTEQTGNLPIDLSKFLPAEVWHQLENDSDFTHYQNVLRDFEVINEESLRSQFLFLLEELAGDYEESCEALYTHFSLIESVLHNAMDEAEDQKNKLKIIAVKNECENMWNYVADELRRFQFYKESISKSITGDLRLKQDSIPDEDSKISDIIRMLHATGIINHLKDRYKETSNLKIAKFFEYITQKPLIADNTNTLFTTDTTNVKYLMRNLSLTKKQQIKNKLEEFKFY